MIGPVTPGGSFDAYAEGFNTGLVGQISVAIYDQNNTVITAPTTAGIVEVAPIGTLARYYWNGTAPAVSDTYLIVWDDNAADPNSASEELLVSNEAAIAGGANWITGDDVAECCDVTVGSDTSLLDGAAAAANDVLYQLSGQQFQGLQGPVKVRPHSYCDHWARLLPSWVAAGPGPIWTSNGWWWGGRSFGCAPLSKVTLAGQPIREIIAVKINGVVLAADEYRLDYNRDLIRMRDTAEPNRQLLWPGCQILDLPDTEQGTWSVTYTWGADPPWQAVEAAKELACEIYKACDDGSAECLLPSGVTRVTRQGVTVERSVLAAALSQGSLGLPMCDLFLGAYNPNRIERRAAVWSPDVPRYPYRPGG